MLIRAGTLFREYGADEMRAECVDSWLVKWCPVRFDLVDELPVAQDISIGGLTVPVLPLTVLVAQDRDAADVFDTVRTVLSG